MKKVLAIVIAVMIMGLSVFVTGCQKTTDHSNKSQGNESKEGKTKEDKSQSVVMSPEETEKEVYRAKAIAISEKYIQAFKDKDLATVKSIFKSAPLSYTQKTVDFIADNSVLQIYEGMDAANVAGISFGWRKGEERAGLTVNIDHQGEELKITHVYKIDDSGNVELIEDISFMHPLSAKEEFFVTPTMGLFLDGESVSNILTPITEPTGMVGTTDTLMGDSLEFKRPDDKTVKMHPYTVEYEGEMLQINNSGRANYNLTFKEGSATHKKLINAVHTYGGEPDMIAVGVGYFFEQVFSDGTIGMPVGFGINKGLTPEGEIIDVLSMSVARKINEETNEPKSIVRYYDITNRTSWKIIQEDGVKIINSFHSEMIKQGVYPITN